MADEKFTPGAMRAAQQIMDDCRDSARVSGAKVAEGDIPAPLVVLAARLISHETRDADLFAALEDLLEAIGDELPYNCKAMRNVRLTAESALRKAREGK